MSRESSSVGLLRFVLSDTEFSTLVNIISGRTGLHFSPEKRREFQLKLERLPQSNIPENPLTLIEAARESDEVLQKLINVLL